MKKEKWSDYDSYVALSAKSNTKLKGTFQTFLNFKQVMGIVNDIANSDKSSYLYEGNIYSRRITSNEAKKIVSAVSENRWTEHTKKLTKIATQLGVFI